MKREDILENITAVEKMIGNVKQEKKDLKKELEGLKKQLEELPKLEVGKWYVSGSCLLCITEHEQDNDYCAYGFISDSWVNGYFEIDEERPATDKEVKTALIAEAKKFIGKTVICVLNGKSEVINLSMNINVFFDSLGVSVWFQEEGRGVCVLKDGKWATIQRYS